MIWPIRKKHTYGIQHLEQHSHIKTLTLDKEDKKQGSQRQQIEVLKYRSLS